MPIAPNLIERTALLTLNQGPAPMLDMWSGPAFWIVHAALRLGLFAALDQTSLSAVQIAQAIDADPQSVHLLLEALLALGYVNQRGEHYTNSAMTRKWLLPSGRIDLTPFYLYWGALMQHFLPDLARAIRSGTNMDLYGWLETQPDISQYFQAGMVQLARYIVDDILAAITLPPDAERLLDVGGGHGEYSVAFCKQFPALSALIYDREEALAAGRTTIAAADMEQRIATHPGNFLVDPLPDGFDIALVFNIVHGLTPAQTIELLRKLRAALKPGGQILILEQAHDAGPLPLLRTVSHILSIAYYHLIGGQVYSAEELHQWLITAGFDNVQRHSIAKAGSILLCATRD